MKTAVLLSAMGVLSSFGTVAGAEEIGRVISSTPAVQQVAVPRQVCSQQQVMQQPSGGGAVVGAIVGGLLGNTIGHGMGRAAATGLGVVAGAAVGDSVETRGRPQAVQQCTTQTFYENRTTGYNVVYEYAGKQYNVQLPYDPGPTIRLQLTPVGAANTVPDTAVAPSGPGVPQPVIVAPPVGQTPRPAVGQPIAQIISVAPSVYPGEYAASTYYAPTYYAPTYYAPAYRAPYAYHPPVGLSFNFGYSSGWGHRHRHGHRHWR